MLITEPKKIETFYQALLQRNHSFVGIFFVGVKTTSVFCISTCRARKPKLENVEFYTSFKSALDNGYRPCKVCRPTQNANQAPEQVELALKLLKENPKTRITDHQLRKVNISPEILRRWFNKNHGMTFQAYQRMYKINRAYHALKNGKNATNTAFDTGYESLSGFGYTFKKLVGKAPSKSADKNIILINRLTTPLGPMLICASQKGICLLKFADVSSLENEVKALQNLLKANVISGENEHINQAKKELVEYFAGMRKSFDVALEILETDIQYSVWKWLREIAYGETITYGELAKKIAIPRGAKRIASASRKNPISIMVPCHRVTGKEDEMTGNDGNLERKKWLIYHERRYAKAGVPKKGIVARR